MKISGSPDLGTLTPRATERPSTLATRPSRPTIDDSVTFSSEARARANAASHSRWGTLSAAAHGDPELANQLAYDLAHDVQQPSLDITEWMTGKGPIRYSGTGEPVTPASEARYAKLAHDFQSASLSLYNRELARGSSPATIFDKLLGLGDAQSAELRSIINWDGQSIT